MTTLDQRIRDDIEAHIRSGDWRPGHRIPFEHELVARYGCARATVSKALSALAQAGLIERRRKAGSFVAAPQVHAAVLDIPDLARLDGYRWECRETHRAATSPELAEARGPLLVIEGVHHAGGQPLALEHRAIDLATVPEAGAADFAQIAPGSWLLDHVAWSDARHRIRAIAADAAQARALDVTPGTACLVLERRTWRRGAFVTDVRQIFPGDRYDLTAEFGPTR